MNVNALPKCCLRCGFHSCICGKPHPEERCPAGCGHALGMHSTQGCSKKNGHDVYCSCGYVPLIVRDAVRQTTVLLYPCKTHPRYQAKRAPRIACEGCWRLWIHVNP